MPPRGRRALPFDCNEISGNLPQLPRGPQQIGLLLLQADRSMLGSHSGCALIGLPENKSSPLIIRISLIKTAKCLGYWVVAQWLVCHALNPESVPVSPM